MPKTKVLDISQSSAQLILKSNSLLLATQACQNAIQLLIEASIVIYVSFYYIHS